jgi:hypothetical protein
MACVSYNFISIALNDTLASEAIAFIPNEDKKEIFVSNRSLE